MRRDKAIKFSSFFKKNFGLILPNILNLKKVLGNDKFRDNKIII